MKPLLPIDSPTYLRRLVRALNEVGMVGAFYCEASPYSIQCNRARLRAGNLECHSLATGAWLPPSSLSFSDAYGRDIVASRRA